MWNVDVRFPFQAKEKHHRKTPSCQVNGRIGTVMYYYIGTRYVNYISERMVLVWTASDTVLHRIFRIRIESSICMLLGYRWCCGINFSILQAKLEFAFHTVMSHAYSRYKRFTGREVTACTKSSLSWPPASLFTALDYKNGAASVILHFLRFHVKRKRLCGKERAALVWINVTSDSKFAFQPIRTMHDLNQFEIFNSTCPPLHKMYVYITCTL